MALKCIRLVISLYHYRHSAKGGQYKCIMGWKKFQYYKPPAG